MQLIEPGADLLIAHLPEDYAIKRRKGSTDAAKKPGAALDPQKVVRDLITPAPKAGDQKPTDGYRQGERQDMERLIGNTQQQ